jgi:hypothetical protein
LPAFESASEVKDVAAAASSSKAAEQLGQPRREQRFQPLWTFFAIKWRFVLGEREVGIG